MSRNDLLHDVGDNPGDSFLRYFSAVGRSMNYLCEHEGEARVSFRAAGKYNAMQKAVADSPEDNRSLGKTRLPEHSPFCSGSKNPPA